MTTKKPRGENYERMKPFLDASWGRNVTPSPGAIKGMKESEDYDEYEKWNDLRKEHD
jgi:hypothetical protein